MQGEGGDHLLQGGVEPFGVPFLDIHEMDVVVREDRAEVRAQKQAVLLAEKDRLDGGEFFDRFHDRSL